MGEKILDANEYSQRNRFKFKKIIKKAGRNECVMKKVLRYKK